MIAFKQTFYVEDFEDDPIVMQDSLLSDEDLSFSYQFPLSFGKPFLQLTKGASCKRVGTFSDSYTFYTWLNNYLYSVNTGCYVDFILNSTSYKVEMFVVKKKRILVLDLGFSHLVNIKLPRYTGVLVGKRKFAVHSFDFWWMTNFAKFCQRLRFPNAYTSKGIVLKGQVFTLKPGKRRQ